MKTNRMNFLFLVIILLFFVSLFVGCNDPELSSKWCDRGIIVDGIDTEWQDCVPYYDKETRVLIGMYNDEDYLYIRLSSRHHEIQRQVLVAGLTVWFEQKANNKRTFGVHFPVGILPEKRMSMFRDSSGKDADLLRQLLEMPQKEIQLLGPGENEQITMAASNIRRFDINVKVDEAEGNLVYELKVPLTQNEQTPYAVLTDKADRIRIGFETGKIELEKMDKNHGQRHTMDKGRGGMGRRSGGMGRGRGGMNREQSGGRQVCKPLELWINVNLASKLPHTE